MKTGRPPLYKKAMRKWAIKLTDDHVKVAKQLGKKNVSNGIRIALEQAYMGVTKSS